MTNKKKKPRKRPYVPPQRGAVDAPPVPKKQTADRPERRERKAEVREQKHKELKRWQRRQTMRKVLVAVLILALLGGVTGFILYNRAQEAEKTEALLAEAAAAQKEAGCGPVQEVEPYDPEEENATHVTDFPALDTYPTTPPASGPHAGEPLAGGFYDTVQPFGGPGHSIEHGSVIVWYSPDADPKAIAELKTFVEANKDHLLMVPFDYPDEGNAGRLPEGMTMALVAWQRLQLCEEPSKAVVANFISKYRQPTLNGGPYEGVAPEAGAPI